MKSIIRLFFLSFMRVRVLMLLKLLKVVKNYYSIIALYYFWVFLYYYCIVFRGDDWLVLNVVFLDEGQNHSGRENLLIFETLPGVIACPNILTFVLASWTVSSFPFITFYLPSLSSTQLSFSSIRFSFYLFVTGESL